MILAPAVVFGPRDAEVHDHRLLVGVDHHVFGLQVTVDDSRLVCGNEPFRYLLRDLECPRYGQPTFLAQHVRQVASFDERHRQVLDAVDLADVVNADDVLVRDLARKQKLTLETMLELGRYPGIGADFRFDDFERDCEAQFVVPRLVHHTHAARSELPQNPVARAEGGARRERTSGQAASSRRLSSR